MPMRAAPGVSRRELLRAAAALGVTVTVTRLGEARSLADGANPSRWAEGGRARFRQDGVRQVTADKVFGMDIRTRDMPGWPAQQAHAFLLRTPRADRVWAGLDLARLDDGLQPDRLVTHADLARDGLSMPKPDFYGDLFLEEGRTPLFLGQPVALLIYHDFARFRAAKARLRFREDTFRYGAETGPAPREHYGANRLVRIGGPDPYAEDVFSPRKNDSVRASFRDDSPAWPEAPDGSEAALEAMRHAERISAELDSPPPDWRIFSRSFFSQSVDSAAMEPDSGIAWYDGRNLAVVMGTQSPYEDAKLTIGMVRDSRLPLEKLDFVTASTVGYGSKEHPNFPFYIVLAALYAEGRPVRLAFDRWEHFQSALKRHPFWIDTTIAVDHRTGEFRSLRAHMKLDGGGRPNFSDSVGIVGATALQSVYYFPKSDLAAHALASRAVTAGSMRGYGTLQTMTSTEMMVDEIAQEMGIDAIDLRLRNVMKPGMRNNLGSIPAGSYRAEEILRRAQTHPLWQEREARKRRFEAERPGHLHGIGFACVQKNYGTGAEAALVQVEVSETGRIRMRHVTSEIGCGATTSQMLVVAEVLGRPADEALFAVTDWPWLELHTEDQPYSATQEEEDRASRDPRWVPRITSPRSASNSAYFMTHATREAARLVMEQGLWRAARAIWGRGIGGGQMGALAVRREEVRWVDGRLVGGSLEALPFERLCAEAHRRGFVVGATIHTFNRWGWAEAEFDLGGEVLRLPIDAMSLKLGAGAPPEARDAMGEHGYAFIPRRRVFYPPVTQNNAVSYHAANACLVELSVNSGSGKVTLLTHHSIMECGRMIVPELVHGQLEGGLAMGIGHALYEYLPLYEDGPGNGTWNFNRYRLPRAADVAVWSQTAEILPPLSETDPPKGIAEVVMIPVVPAIANAIAHATGLRFRELPITAEKIREALT